MLLVVYMYIDLLKLRANKLLENSDADLPWQAVADLVGVQGVRMNPLKFPDFLGGWGKGFECTDTRSNQAGFHNTTDVSFICSKKKTIISRIGHWLGDFNWSKDKFWYWFLKI